MRRASNNMNNNNFKYHDWYSNSVPYRKLNTLIVEKLIKKTHESRYFKLVIQYNDAGSVALMKSKQLMKELC